MKMKLIPLVAAAAAALVVSGCVAHDKGPYAPKLSPAPALENTEPVVLMDPRVLTRGYGEMLLDSLPPARRVTGPWDDVRLSLIPFFKHRARKSGSDPVLTAF